MRSASTSPHQRMPPLSSRRRRPTRTNSARRCSASTMRTRVCTCICDDSTHEQIIAGLGETHIVAAAERMERKFRASVTIGEPRVAYRGDSDRAGSSARPAQEADGRPRPIRRCLAGASEPLPARRRLRVRRPGGGPGCPQELHPCGREGVRDALSERFLAGDPVADVRVILDDGLSHPVDSSEMAFRSRRP